MRKLYVLLIGMQLPSFCVADVSKVFDYGSDDEADQQSCPDNIFAYGSSEEEDRTDFASCELRSRTGHSSSSRVDGRGKYVRSATKGVHVTWNARAEQHMQALANGTWVQECPCGPKCTFSKSCWDRITKTDFRDCVEHTFGHSNVGQPPTVTHSSATHKWFDFIWAGRCVDPQSRAVVGITYKLSHASGVEVCCRAACALFACPPTTWNAMVDAVMRGKSNWRENQAITVRQTQRWAETKKNDSIHWWIDRIKQCAPPFSLTRSPTCHQMLSQLLNAHHRYEQMPMKTTAGASRLILHAPCVFNKVFSEEFLAEMVDCLGKTYWVPPADHETPAEFGISSWYEGRKQALVEIAKEIFSDVQDEKQLPRLRLKMRTLHHDFGHCPECNAIASERADIRKYRLGEAALQANNERAQKHAAMYMGERRALDTYRLSSGRGDVLFCMRDKCGDECLYLPSSPRQILTNKSKYQWRMAAQFELYPGKLTLISLLPAHCFAGANFGCTSLLTGITTLMDFSIFTTQTKRLILNEDGGSENVNWCKHALCMQLIKELTTLDEILIARLPPEHHHDWADTTIGVLEDALNMPGFKGVETLPDMQQFIRNLFSKSKSYGKSPAVVLTQMANHDFEAFYTGHVDADFSSYGKPHVWRFSRCRTSLQPVAQYKQLIQDTGNFYQDEWGPWDEHFVSRTDEFGRLERNVRVLRSTPGGVPFMLSYPKKHFQRPRLGKMERGRRLVTKNCV